MIDLSKLDTIARRIVSETIANGGVTFDLNEPSPHSLRALPLFAVGISKRRERRFPVDSLSPARLLRFVKHNLSKLAAPGADGMRYALGTWIDGDAVVLDVTAVVVSRNRAIQLGTKAKQSSICDLATGCCFDIDDSIPIPAIGRRILENIDNGVELVEA